MLSRTFPSLARTLVSPIAGSSKSRTNYGILRQTTQIGSLAQTQTQTPTYTRMYSTPPAESAPGAATMDEGERAIYEKLSAKFPGNRLEVQDVSGELLPPSIYLQPRNVRDIQEIADMMR